MSANFNNGFFDTVDTRNLPDNIPEKEQPWAVFHQADPNLTNAKSIIVDVPTTVQAGMGAKTLPSEISVLLKTYRLLSRFCSGHRFAWGDCSRNRSVILVTQRLFG